MYQLFFAFILISISNIAVGADLDLTFGYKFGLSSPKGPSASPPQSELQSPPILVSVGGDILWFPGSSKLGFGFGLDVPFTVGDIQNSGNTEIGVNTVYFTGAAISRAILVYEFSRDDSALLGKLLQSSSRMLLGYGYNNTLYYTYCPQDSCNVNVDEDDIYKGPATAFNIAYRYTNYLLHFIVFSFELGYEYIKADELKLNDSRLVDSTDKSIAIDLSSPYFGLGLGFHF